MTSRNSVGTIRAMRVCIVGLGKIGLPLALQVCSRGHEVIGADIDQRVVDLVNSGTAPFPGEPGLDERLRHTVAEGSLTASTDTTAAVGDCDVVIVVVPLVIGADFAPAFGALDAATAAVAAGIKPGTLVCYETTLPVGTTRDRFAPVLAAPAELTIGDDLFVCFSPERVSSGRVFEDLRRYPKLVGGVDPASGHQAVAFYDAVLDFDDRPDLEKENGVWDVGSSEAAELVKLAETTYRDVNIALANEFARYADTLGVDVYKVIDAANSQPYSHIHRPGIAVGGHCIPVYPHLYLSTDPTAQMPASSRRVNDRMPAYAVDLLAELAGDLAGRRVVVLGAAYRGGVKETAFSGVFGTVAELEARGAVAEVHDPMYSDQELRAIGFAPHALGSGCDAAVLQADHAEYGDLTPADLPGVTAIVDGRRVLDPGPWTSAGVGFAVIGAPTDPG